LTDFSSSRTQWHKHNKFPAQNGTRFHRTNQPETRHTRYDPLGEMFSHPLAHVHIGNGDTPRFALQGDGDGNVLMDFLEFVYRNFAYDKWRLWAGRKWSKTYPTRVAEFDQIARYFAVSDFMGLRQDAKIITDIKKVLRRARQDSFDCKAQPTDLALMQYP
jgi:hypothetical protein